ncbi:MAG: GNAT family N-acetyltransferase [Vampirovibrionales bacterium]|nr:GNAT family N-acetyltransferase [Vampirovibrionales bacterium]
MDKLNDFKAEQGLMHRNTETSADRRTQAPHDAVRIDAVKPGSKILQTPASPEAIEGFREIWQAHFLAKFKARVIHPEFVVQPKKMLKGLLSLTELRPVGWNSGWHPAFSPQIVQQCLDLPANTRWDVWRFTLDTPDLDASALAMLKQAGYAYGIIPDQPAYSIDVAYGLEAYMRNLSKDYRKTFTRKLNKLKLAGLVSEQVDVTETTTVAEFFDTFFKHHLAYWDAKAGGSYFHDACERDYIIAWCEQLKAQGKLLLLETRINGTPVTLHMQVRLGSTVWSFLIINTGQYLDYYPGIVSIYHHLARAKAMGVTRIHLGPGDHNYKKGLCNVVTPRSTVIIANRQSLMGRAYLAMLKRKQG